MASILVVDDEEQMCGLLETLLGGAGHEVVTTTDPREVPVLMAAKAFNLVVVDIVMPRRDGTEVIRELRQNFPGVGIVAMSGASPMRRELFLEASKLLGADATFEKPFKNDEVLASVSEAISKSALRTKSG